MKKTLLAIAVATTSLASLNTHAAQSVELHLKGRIVPAACDLQLTAGSTADIGTIFAATLSEDDWTPIPEKALPFTVNCDSSVLVALRATDNRADSVMDMPGHGEGTSFGLGLANDVKLGGYQLAIDNLSGADGSLTALRDTGSTGPGDWIAQDTFQPSRGALISFATSTDAVRGMPSAVSLVTGEFKFRNGYIQPKKNLPLSEGAAIDGMATVELVYL